MRMPRVLGGTTVNGVRAQWERGHSCYTHHRRPEVTAARWRGASASRSVVVTHWHSLPCLPPGPGFPSSSRGRALKRISPGWPNSRGGPTREELPVSNPAPGLIHGFPVKLTAGKNEAWPLWIRGQASTTRRPDSQVKNLGQGTGLVGTCPGLTSRVSHCPRSPHN